MQQEENSLDFKSLRAKFQEEEVMLLKQPRTKPALHEKPKELPPPHSPTSSPIPLSPTSHAAFHNLPAGAQPSLLSSLQEKGSIEPRFTFKEAKEKTVKGKDKDEGKVKLLGKKKADAKAYKEKEDKGMNGWEDVDGGVRSDLLDQKPKNEADLSTKSMKSKRPLLSTGGSKGGSVELVSAAPPPVNQTVKKNRFLGIKKSLKPEKKRKGVDSPFPLLDIASADLACPEPLAPLTTFGSPAPPADTPIPSPFYQPATATHITLLPPAPIPAPLLNSPAPRLTNPRTVPSPPILIPAPATQAITAVIPPDAITRIPDPGVVQPITRIPDPGVVQPVARIPDPGVVKPVARIPDPGVVKPVARIPDRGVVKPVARIPDPGVVKPVARIPDPGVVKPVARIPDPGVVKPVARIPDPGVVKPVARIPDPAVVQPVTKALAPVAPAALEVKTPAQTIPAPTLPAPLPTTPSRVPAPPRSMPTPSVTRIPPAVVTPPPPAKPTPPPQVIATPPPPDISTLPPPIVTTPPPPDISTLPPPIVTTPPPLKPTPPSIVNATSSPPTVAMPSPSTKSAPLVPTPPFPLAVTMQSPSVIITTPPPAFATPPPPVNPSPSPPPPHKPPAPTLDSDVPVQPSPSGPPSHTPPPPEMNLTIASQSPPPEKHVSVQERPLTPLSVLGRAEEMTTPKRKGSDIILNALEKAKRKYTSPLNTPNPSTPPSPIASTVEDPPSLPSPSPTPGRSLPELPPIDYDDQAEVPQVTPLKPTLVNGIRQVPPSLDGIAEEGAGDELPALLVVPPPPPKRRLPEASTLGPPPEKPPRPPSMDLNIYAVEIPAPLEFSEAHPGLDIPKFEDVRSGLQALQLQPAGSSEIEASEWGNSLHDHPKAVLLEAAYTPEIGLLENQPLKEGKALPEDLADVKIPEQLDPVPASPSSQDPQPAAGDLPDDGNYEAWNNAYEMLSAKQKVKGQPTKKKKEAKNPYAQSQSPTEEKAKTRRFSKKPVLETPDEKELKKREKQRLEKEKKEQKEQKEREKKEQKEREKENEIKKKFKITGQEEAMYQATVMAASKGRRDNLSVKNGDIIGIIRTTNCPKGKWLARDRNNTYGYISVSQVELDIKEMLVIGKMASQAISKKDSSHPLEQGREMASRTSSHYPQQDDTGSFTDDSEEWTCDEDDDEPHSYPEEEPTEISGHVRTMSGPEMGTKEPSFQHQHTLSETTTDGMDIQARHEALQKLATFFHKPVVEEPMKWSPQRPEKPKPKATCKVDQQEPEPVHPHVVEAILELPDTVILPPPDLYADVIM